MTHPHMRQTRLASALAAFALLAACDTGPLEIRDGPQDVHPAPPAINHFDDQECHSHPNDGCRPIID